MNLTTETCPINGRDLEIKNLTFYPYEKVDVSIKLRIGVNQFPYPSPKTVYRQFNTKTVNVSFTGTRLMNRRDSVSENILPNTTMDSL